MNYNDIKDKVISTSEGISQIPSALLNYMLYPLTRDIHYCDLPSIKVITHAEMWEDDRRGQCVRSVLMNGQAAFIFIGVGKEFRDCCSYYVLNKEAMTSLLQYLTSGSQAHNVIGGINEYDSINEYDAIPELEESHGLDMQFGTKHQLINDKWCPVMGPNLPPSKWSL